MSGKVTFTIIKPFAVSEGHIGPILHKIHDAGFKISAMRMLWLTKGEAERFYEVHKERPFYNDLVKFMTSGPCMPILLRRENAVPELRAAIGATDPAEADEGTVRALYAESKERNAIHASDSEENAETEISFFFAGTERLRG